MVLTAELPIGVEDPEAALLQKAAEIQGEQALADAAVAEEEGRMATMDANTFEVEMILDRAWNIAEKRGWLTVSLGRQHPLT
jgi:hypothetical protein